MQCVIGNYWQCSCEVKKAAETELTKGPPEIKLGECSEIIIWHDPTIARDVLVDIKPGQIRDFWTYQARASFRPFKLSGSMEVGRCGSYPLTQACEIVNIGTDPLTYKAL